MIFKPLFSGQKTSGFTLIETIVSISIVAVISVLFLANYKYASQQATLNNAARKLASDTRTAQSYTLGSKEFNCGGVNKVPPGGWGVLISPTLNSYTLFADCNGNKLYEADEKYKENDLPGDVEITSPSWSVPITFVPPDPDTYIEAEASVSLTITLRNKITNRTKDIFINFLGLVDLR
jgi:prepilin-type N-terminal cleavage/methylation domain-containing protein